MAVFDRVPQRRRAVLLQLGVENPDERVAVRRELRRIDLDAVAEAADARFVVGQHRADERLRRLLLELEVRLHAAAAIEQHHQRDRLDVVGEQRERLPPAVVVHREILARQVGHETAARVGHRREHRHRVGAGLKRRRLRLLRRRDESDRGGEDGGDATERAAHGDGSCRSWLLHGISRCALAPLVLFTEVHPSVERAHLVGIAVEHQCLTFEELADAPFARLAPARMRSTSGLTLE